MIVLAVSSCLAPYVAVIPISFAVIPPCALGFTVVRVLGPILRVSFGRLIGSIVIRPIFASLSAILTVDALAILVGARVTITSHVLAQLFWPFSVIILLVVSCVITIAFFQLFRPPPSSIILIFGGYASLIELSCCQLPSL